MDGCRKKQQQKRAGEQTKKSHTSSRSNRHALQRRSLGSRDGVIGKLPAQTR
jgi:hypothetical protein